MSARNLPIAVTLRLLQEEAEARDYAICIEKLRQQGTVLTLIPRQIALAESPLFCVGDDALGALNRARLWLVSG